MLWGIEENVTDRFMNAGIPKHNISCTKETFTFIAPYSPSHFVAVFRKYYGPTMNAFEAAEKNSKATELQTELEELFISQNKSKEKNTTSIDATFLKVTVLV